MPLDLIRTTKGKPRLCIDSHLYNQDKVRATKTTWECQERKKFKCKARATTEDDEISSRSGDHNHAPDLAKLEGLRTAQQMYQRASTTQDATRVIVAEGTVQVSAPAMATMPKEESLNRMINRRRQKSSNAPANPGRLQDPVIPQEYQNDNSGNSFLRADSGPGDDRIIIYATDEGIELLTESTKWFMDGTFKVSPSLFYQMYTIHALEGEAVYPCAYALLPDKRKETYERMFEMLKAAPGGDRLSPTWILTDLEQGALTAVDTAFPGVEKKACFFHLAQASWRKLQELGHSARYAIDPDFANLCRLLPALAFVPLRKVPEAFQKVAEEFERKVGEELDDYLAYFEKTYIGRTVNGRWKHALFPPSLWNQYNNTVEKLPRTNNSVEGWHRAFQSSIGAAHPTIWKFIDAIKNEESLVAFRRTQRLAGHPAPKRRRYEDVEERIANCVAKFDQQNTLTYLRGLSYNVHF